MFERLDGALPLLHLQRCICTWQPPILTALPSFPIKLVWTQATEARNYNSAAVPGSLQFWLPYLLFPSSWCGHKPPKQETINLHRQCYMPLQVCKQRHFPFHLQCFEHLLHHGTRGLPLNTSMQLFPPTTSVPTQDSQHWLSNFRVWIHKYWSVAAILYFWVKERGFQCSFYLPALNWL